MITEHKKISGYLLIDQEVDVYLSDEIIKELMKSAYGRGVSDAKDALLSIDCRDDSQEHFCIKAENAIVKLLRIEANREPHEPIWRDAIDEIRRLRIALELVREACAQEAEKTVTMEGYEKEIARDIRSLNVGAKL